MGMSTFTGPITAGDVLDTTGSTPGTLKNVGYVEMAQSFSITQAGSTTALATNIVIPAGSQVLAIDAFATVAWGSAGTLSVGTSATATELVAATAINAVGRFSLTPGTDATRTASWIDVGTSDVQVYVKSSSGTGGAAVVTVRYIQAIGL